MPVELLKKVIFYLSHAATCSVDEPCSCGLAAVEDELRARGFLPDTCPDCKWPIQTVGGEKKCLYCLGRRKVA